MPRRLLRDGRVVADDWTYLDELGNGAGGMGLILTFDQWLADKPKWLEGTARLGVVLSPAHKVEQLAPDLAHLQLVGARFPGTQRRPRLYPSSPAARAVWVAGRVARHRLRTARPIVLPGALRLQQLSSFLTARSTRRPRRSRHFQPNISLATTPGSRSSCSAVSEPPGYSAAASGSARASLARPTYVRSHRPDTPASGESARPLSDRCESARHRSVHG